MDLPLLEREMTILLKTRYFEFQIGSVTQNFTNIAVVAERIEQAIKVGIVNSEVMMEFELGNDSQIRNFVRSDLIILLAVQTSLPKIGIHLPLKVFIIS